MNWIPGIIGLLGHFGIWATVFNQIHASSCRRSARKNSEKIILLITFLPLIAWGCHLFPWTRFGWKQLDLLPECLNGFVRFYAWISILVGLFFSARWLVRKFTDRRPASVASSKLIIRNLRTEIGRNLLNGTFSRTLGLVPFNQVSLLCEQRMEFRLDIPAQLDGFKICQLSDLHFTGQVEKEYFVRVVEAANKFQPDLILITGDILDVDQCISWLADTVGELKAKLGCYYILGNHDRLVQDETAYFRELDRTGLKRVNGNWIELSDNGCSIRLAGNETPWYSGAELLIQLPRRTPDEIRILMTHSPDQIKWARQFEFDLILAGHTHGGQISFPIVGPVIVPSRYGVKYASGQFQLGRALMHVSRGISGDETIRINALPELGLITLRSTRIGQS